MDTQYAAVWEKRTGPAWQARHGLSIAQFVQAMSDMDLENKVPVEISGYNVDNNDTYAAIWVERPGPWPGGMEVVQGMSNAEYQKFFDRLGSGNRLVNLCGYTVAGQDLYAAIWVQMPGPDWVARHGLSASEYQLEFDTLVGQGYRLTHVSGY